jgi:hypothetical protein
MFEHFLSEEENNRAANVHNSEPNFFRILRSFAPLPNIQMLFNQGQRSRSPRFATINAPMLGLVKETQTDERLQPLAELTQKSVQRSGNNSSLEYLKLNSDVPAHSVIKIWVMLGGRGQSFPA